MQYNQSESAILSGQVRANLDQYPDDDWKKLTREQVYGILSASFNHYFASRVSVPVSAAPMVQSGPVVGGKGGSGVPTQWSRILNSKEYGVCTYFKSVYEEMKKATPGLNFFVAVSQIRTRYEGTAEWSGYLAWVRAKHPEPSAVEKDPSPRKVVSQAVVTSSSSPQAMIASLPMQVQPSQVPSMPVPSIPASAVSTQVPSVSVPMSVPMPVPCVPDF